MAMINYIKDKITGEVDSKLNIAKARESVDKVVDFWIEKSFNTPMNQDNGDQSENGVLSYMLMNTVSEMAKEEVTDEKIDMFRERLTEILMNRMREKGIIYDCSVDYHPSPGLKEACEYADIPTGCLPCKTWTRIDRDLKATASYQYGGEIQEL